MTKEFQLIWCCEEGELGSQTEIELGQNKWGESKPNYLMNENKIKWMLKMKRGKIIGRQKLVGMRLFIFCSIGLDSLYCGKESFKISTYTYIPNVCFMCVCKTSDRLSVKQSE